MESLYLLIPISILLVGLIVGLLFISVRGGQFDDMEGPAHSILMDNDTENGSKQHGEAKKLDADQDSHL